MNRSAPFALVVAVPIALIGWKLWQQDRLLHAPSGGSAVIEGTEVALSARLSARVVELPHPEGTAVKRGDVLVRLDCADTDALVAEAHAKLDAARAQLRAAQAQAQAATGAEGAAKGAARATAAQVGAVSAQRDAASRQAARLDTLADDVTVAARDQTRSGADALTQQASAAAAQADAAAAQARAAHGQATAAAAQADAAAEQVKATEAAVARADLLVAECVITAPRDGWVDALPYDVGELVPAGQTAARLVDVSEVTATFYLPNDELRHAVPGASATVVADAYPDRTFPATLRTVATSAEFTPRNVQTRTDRDRLVFPVELVIANPDGALRPGMPVQIELTSPGGA